MEQTDLTNAPATATNKGNLDLRTSEMKSHEHIGYKL